MSAKERDVLFQGRGPTRRNTKRARAVTATPKSVNVFRMIFMTSAGLCGYIRSGEGHRLEYSHDLLNHLRVVTRITGGIVATQGIFKGVE